MIFDKLKEALATHRTVVKEGFKEFQKVRDELTDMYTLKYSREQINKAKEKYDQVVWESELEVRKTVKEILGELKSRITEVASKPIDPDFIPTLAVIDRMKDPTKLEIDQMVGKFKNNYVCYRAVCDSVGGAIKGYSSIKLEDVLKRCDQVEDKVNRALKGDVDGYSYRMLVDSIVLDNYAGFFEDFFAGSFDEITEALSKEKKNKNFVE